MTRSIPLRSAAFALLLGWTALAAAQAQRAPSAYQPEVGQPGKDVVWVPTPQAVVDKMLDMAKLTPKDFLMDLGSGDGRTVITAAKRGARAHRHRVQPRHGRALEEQCARQQASTSARSSCKADLFETDFSKAHRHHHVPAAGHQPEAAAEAPGA